MGELSGIGMRFALYADLMLLTGLAAFPLHAIGRGAHGNRLLAATLAAPLRWLAGIGLVVSGAGMVVLTANMHGTGLLSVDLEMLSAMLRETDAGSAWLVGMGALAIAAGAAAFPGKRPATACVVIALAGSVALATLAWSGHAGATEAFAGAVHRASDAVHMIAAAIWLGAIVAFLLLLRPRRRGVQRNRAAIALQGLHRFARTGTICVSIIAATGLVNAELIVGLANAGASFAAPYGRLLAIKLLLFGSMLILAGLNRWRLTPGLARSFIDGDTPAAVGAMRRSLAAEAFAGMAILALVAWFGTLDPLPAISAG